MEWKFQDSPNTAVFTTKRVASSESWIGYVYHDAEDGAWQFHAPEASDQEEPMIVGLSEIVNLDRSVEILADLPRGYYAWRENRDAAWQKAKTEQ